jgi:hypothetical protein
MVDLFGQLATLATIVAGRARQAFRRRNRGSERQRQYEYDENGKDADMNTRLTEAKLLKLHTRYIGLEHGEL